MLAADLISFEREVADAFESKKIKGPVHLYGGGEEILIEIFENIKRTDSVFASYRFHPHALLHGVPRDELMAHLLGQEPMGFQSKKYRFFTSAIVGGQIPIAVGAAAGIKMKGEDRKVWCFVGDMAAETGIMHEAHKYSCQQELPITFVIESNGLSCDTPTQEVWGKRVGYLQGDHRLGYIYERTWPHVCTGKHVEF